MDQEQRYIIDRIGEETDLENCSLCHAASCFSCVQGFCTALEKVADGGCVFYKDAEENHREIRRCFYRLVWHERFDLLEKYADTLAALGLMDEETVDAESQHKKLEAYRVRHLNELRISGWKDTLEVVRIRDTEEDDDDEEDEEDGEEDIEPEDKPEDAAGDRNDPDEFAKNDLDQAVFPDGVTAAEIVRETAEETYDDQSGLTGADPRGNANLESAGEAWHQFSVDYPSDFDEESFEEGGPLTYAEYLDQAEEAVLEKEAGEERAAQLDQEERDLALGGEGSYNAPSQRSLWNPAMRERRPDPVDLAWSVLGANIVYKAVEDYILTLRLLWSGQHRDTALHRLIVSKWQLETWIGSHAYWQYTNLSPGRILDQCWKTAKEQAQEKIERQNRRIAAGIEDGEEI